jgi:DNA topoisomerase-1
MNVVVVESPAKGKTIEKYLGKDYKVLASYGHVRDLVPKEGAVDTEHGFAMKYEVLEKNEKHIAAIVKALKKADSLLLATDPDREGEAISWHLFEILKERGALKDKRVHRVVFYEITKRAVQDAVDNPRELSNALVEAQQTRRALDFLVGFNISPLLWKKIRQGLSAGRVQSPALRMIVEREEEIEAFKRKEYWTIEGDVGDEPANFVSRLVEYQGKKVEQFSFTNETDANAVRDNLLAAAEGKVRVNGVERKQRFTTQRTMMTAQRLYEGIETDEGTVGLITYMRTDSVTLGNEALVEIRSFIKEKFGEENLPDEARVYKTKAKNAQEAHEAVRPTSVYRTPESLKSYLNADQQKLYGLIWKRTVACQMVHAVYDMVALDLLPLKYVPINTSPNRRRALPKRALSKPWKNTVLAAPRPTRASSRH